VPGGAPDRTAEVREPVGTTVEVSIGRIEIRPPAEPGKKGRPARRGPRLSLEAYLDERRGGRR